MAGRMDEAKGAVKKVAGKVTGNERLEAEGEAQQTTARATRKTKGAADQVAGNVKMGAGKLVGNKRLHAEGQAQDLKGTVERTG